MKERPIIFSAPMVLANRAGIKSQTRRTRGLDRINKEPGAWYLANEEPLKDGKFMFGLLGSEPPEYAPIRCPYGVSGDQLWVRETWKKREDGLKEAWYRADGHSDIPGWPWKPSIHMPRWASRDTLEVVSVRPERLQDISREDAIAEGIQVLPLQSSDDPSAWWQSAPGIHQDRTPQRSYRQLWESLKGPGSWAKNPWCWVISYRRLAERG